MAVKSFITLATGVIVIKLFFLVTYTAGQIRLERVSLKGSYDVSMEQHVFCIFIYYRGQHRKGVAIDNAI